jgi:tRNA 2-thiouridine synthesizing protein E
MHLTVTSAPDVRAAQSRPRFDERGYLVDGDQWSASLAQELAAEEGIERLGPDHWKVIGHVRAQYYALGALPVMRLVCRAAKIDPGTARSLFRGCASLWRIAGLPNPGEEALAYMH